MQIIQVIDLDGTTVKVDNTNPSEPKIASALRFDTGVRKNVAIGDITELVFAKPLNANVEAICVGYKGTDGKYYGITGNGEESIFGASAPKKERREEKFVLGFSSDGLKNMYIDVITTGSEYKGSTGQEELNGRGAKVTEPVYVRFGDEAKLYRFELHYQDPANAHYVLQGIEPYAGSLPTSVVDIEVGTSDNINDTTHTASTQLIQTGATEFSRPAFTTFSHIQTIFTPVNRA